MKFRLAVLISFLLFSAVSCSLAEDITPPPGYQSLNSEPTLTPVSQPASPTQTSKPATVNPAPTPTSTESKTPSEDLTVTPGLALGNITIELVNGSGGNIPVGQEITLVGFDKDSSGNYQKSMELAAQAEKDGSYLFKGVEAPLDRAFIVITSWGGVEYQSDPVFVTAETRDFSVPLTIYENTDDPNGLSFSQVHLFFNSPSGDGIEITELFFVNNPGNKVVTVSSDGTTIPFIHIPDTASNLSYQLSQGSAPLLNATNGFALLPGAEKQYGFIASFSLPYSKSLKFEQNFSLPVSSLTVLTPEGMRLRGEQLIDAGTQDIQGQTYQMFQANNIASGSLLSLTISGKPGDAKGFTLDRQTMVLIAIGVVGILLIGIGVYLYLHDRARFRRENEEDEKPVEVDALGEDRENIMDAMIALDDQYKAGEIPKDAYQTRRSELKDRLKSAL
jgi:hypothetical protein